VQLHQNQAILSSKYVVLIIAKQPKYVVLIIGICSFDYRKQSWAKKSLEKLSFPQANM
jgi:hypothetical protein